MTIFALYVGQLLEEKGLKISDLAHALEMPDSSVRGWWAKDSIPSADTALKVAEYLGTSVKYLLTGIKDSPGDEILNTLSAEEILLIQKYRILDKRDKEDVDDIVNLKGSRYAMKRD